MQRMRQKCEENVGCYGGELLSIARVLVGATRYGTSTNPNGYRLNGARPNKRAEKGDFGA